MSSPASAAGRSAATTGSIPGWSTRSGPTTPATARSPSTTEAETPGQTQERAAHALRSRSVAKPKSPPDPPKVLNQIEAIKLLKAHGWEQGKGGRHQVKMTKDGRIVTLPQAHGNDYGAGLRGAILEQAGLAPRPQRE